MKYLKLTALPAIIMAVLITGFSLKKGDSSSLAKEPQADPEQIKGVSEFYYKPAGDSRVWHVVNKYGCEDPEKRYTLNNSTYTFTADSVTVVNEIATVPDWEPYISGSIFKND